LLRLSGDDLPSIDGLNSGSVLKIIAEIGVAIESMEIWESFSFLAGTMTPVQS
jgi:hypothetical protein